MLAAPLVAHAIAEGWTRVEVATEIDPASCLRLLGALRGEDAAHSWRQLLPATGAIRAADVEHLLEHERQHRPTTFYWFSAVSAGRAPELIGVATVADRMRADLPLEGFPVLARSYIMPSWRTRGGYTMLLRHRVARCLERFGGALRGIHFGTTEPRVLQVAERYMPSRPRYLGDELLALPGGPRRVSDYLMFAPAYTARLRAELSAFEGSRFAELATRLLDGGFGPADYGALWTAGAEQRVEAAGWRELLAFCDAIPLVRA